MARRKKPALGTIAWQDLTVKPTEKVRDFYEKVVGWTPQAVDCGRYDDYNMMVKGVDHPIAGICHARGVNANLPPQWLLYVVVDDVDRRAKLCQKLGGKILHGPRDLGGGRFCAIEDPAGAVIGLYAP